MVLIVDSNADPRLDRESLLVRDTDVVRSVTRSPDLIEASTTPAERTHRVVSELKLGDGGSAD
jgi:hypothetical protein